MSKSANNRTKHMLGRAAVVIRAKDIETIAGEVLPQNVVVYVSRAVGSRVLLAGWTPKVVNGRVAVTGKPVVVRDMLEGIASCGKCGNRLQRHDSVCRNCATEVSTMSAYMDGCFRYGSSGSNLAIKAHESDLVDTAEMLRAALLRGRIEDLEEYLPPVVDGRMTWSRLMVNPVVCHRSQLTLKNDEYALSADPAPRGRS